MNDPRVREANVYIALLWSAVGLLEAVLLGYLLFAAGGVADRILVMSEGRIVYETLRAEADLQDIGHHMAHHGD